MSQSGLLVIFKVKSQLTSHLNMVSDNKIKTKYKIVLGNYKIK